MTSWRTWEAMKTCVFAQSLLGYKYDQSRVCRRCSRELMSAQVQTCNDVPIGPPSNTGLSDWSKSCGSRII